MSLDTYDLAVLGQNGTQRGVEHQSTSEITDTATAQPPMLRTGIDESTPSTIEVGNVDSLVVDPFDDGWGKVEDLFGFNSTHESRSATTIGSTQHPPAILDFNGQPAGTSFPFVAMKALLDHREATNGINHCARIIEKVKGELEVAALQLKRTLIMQMPEAYDLLQHMSLERLLEKLTLRDRKDQEVQAYFLQLIQTLKMAEEKQSRGQIACRMANRSALEALRNMFANHLDHPRAEQLKASIDSRTADLVVILPPRPAALLSTPDDRLVVRNFVSIIDPAEQARQEIEALDTAHAPIQALRDEVDISCAIHQHLEHIYAENLDDGVPDKELVGIRSESIRTLANNRLAIDAFREAEKHVQTAKDKIRAPLRYDFMWSNQSDYSFDDSDDGRANLDLRSFPPVNRETGRRDLLAEPDAEQEEDVYRIRWLDAQQSRSVYVSNAAAFVDWLGELIHARADTPAPASFEDIADSESSAQPLRPTHPPTRLTARLRSRSL